LWRCQEPRWPPYLCSVGGGTSSNGPVVLELVHASCPEAVELRRGARRGRRHRGAFAVDPRRLPAAPRYRPYQSTTIRSTRRIRTIAGRGRRRRPPIGLRMTSMGSLGPSEEVVSARGCWTGDEWMLSRECWAVMGLFGSSALPQTNSSVKERRELGFIGSRCLWSYFGDCLRQTKSALRQAPTQPGLTGRRSAAALCRMGCAQCEPLSSRAVAARLSVAALQRSDSVA